VLDEYSDFWNKFPKRLTIFSETTFSEQENLINHEVKMKLACLIL